MKLIKLSSSILFLCSIILFSGCGSDSVTPSGPTTITVAGKVNDGFGNGIANLLVIIGSSTTTSAADGSFSIASVTTPYDLKLVQTSAVPPTGMVYQGLTTAAPTVLGLGLISAPNSSVVKVDIPPLGITQTALVVYTDSLNTVKTSTINFPNVQATFTVQWAGNTNISGNIMVLVYTLNGTQVGTYDKYGVKLNQVLNNGGTLTTAFTAADLAFNPGEANISGTVSVPAGAYTNIGSRLALSFTTNGSILSNFTAMGTTVGTNFSYVVPTGIANTIKFNVIGIANGPAANSQTTKIMPVVSGSTGNNVTLDEVATLNTPPNAATNIDTTTSFIFSQGTGSAVNLINFSSAGQRLYVFTTSTTVRLPNFNAYGLGELANTNYTWQVEKFGPVNTMDAFVSTSLFLNNNMSALSVSEMRTFTTKP